MALSSSFDGCDLGYTDGENRLMEGSRVVWRDDQEYLMSNPALEAYDVHPHAHCKSSVAKSSAWVPVPSRGMEEMDEVLLEIFMGKSFLGEHLERGSQDST